MMICKFLRNKCFRHYRENVTVQLEVTFFFYTFYRVEDFAFMWMRCFYIGLGKLYFASLTVVHCLSSFNLPFFSV
jgi:hypothetical protein